MFSCLELIVFTIIKASFVYILFFYVILQVNHETSGTVLIVL